MDEQAASVIKWPVPILSATRVEWIPQVQSDLFVLQTPSHLSAPHLESIEQLIRKGQPVAIFGGSEGIDATLLHLAGLRAGATPAPAPSQLCKATGQDQALVKNATIAFNTYCYPENVSASAEARVFYTANGSPRLTLDTTGGKRVTVWNPPDLRSMGAKPLSEIWGNTGAPYALAAGVLNDLLKQNTALHAEEIDLLQTMNVAAWRTKDGALRILAGNLEEGLRDDADFARHATLALPKSWPSANWKNAWTGRTFSLKNNGLDIDLKQAESVLLEPAK